jgi:hypothetical protein
MSTLDFSRGICAEEIDRERWTWTLPAARSRNKRLRVTEKMFWRRWPVALVNLLGVLFPAEM